MNTCAFCNGRLEEIDKYGVEQECLLCGTVYKMLPMGDNSNESDK